MNRPLPRRQFLIRGALVLAGAAASGALRSGRLLAAEAAASPAPPAPALRFGLITDIHYADKNTAGTRFYRDSLAKMQAAVAALNERAKQDAAGLSFAVELGDLVDSAAPQVTDESVAREIAWLKTIEAEWAKAAAERHYVFGNHCVDTLTKAEFIEHTKAKAAPYSFDAPFKRGEGAVHCVVLDACFKADGTSYGRKNFDWRDTNIPESGLRWLDGDLAKTKNPVIVFAHQRLDAAGDAYVKNAAAVRAILEKSGKVLVVLQGHSHQNALATVNGIPYCVARAMVERAGAENNSFSTVEVFPDYTIALRGGFQQTSYDKLAEKKTLSTPAQTPTPPVAV